MAFFATLLGTRDKCKLNKAEYGFAGFLYREKMYRARLTFECKTAKDLRVANRLAAVFQRSSKVAFDNVRLQTESGQMIWLKNLDDSKLVRIDKYLKE